MENETIEQDEKEQLKNQQEQFEIKLYMMSLTICSHAKKCRSYDVEGWNCNHDNSFCGIHKRIARGLKI